MMIVLGVIGGVVLAYVGIRTLATVVDVGWRGVRWLRGDKSAWE